MGLNPFRLHSPETRARIGAKWQGSPALFPLRSSAMRFRHAAGSGPRPIKMLLASDRKEHTSEQQFAPLFRHGAALRKQRGVVLQHRTVEEALAMPESTLAKMDVVGLKLSFRTPAAEAADCIRRFRAAVGRGGTRLVYFDGDDDLNVQWPEVLPLVDLYLKKHMFADAGGYVRRYIGKSNLTDYVADQHGISFAADIIPESGGADANATSRIMLGWNIGLDDKIVALARRIGPLSSVGLAKDIDIACVAPVSNTVWIGPLRRVATDRVRELAGRFRVFAPQTRIAESEFYGSMLRSRICVSPFGFGEICWRDFEAICCGCLLVKPDMSHITTAPDIFIPGVTYVPVKWDYSDLEEKCAVFLENEHERKKIAQNAAETLIASLRAEWLLARIDAMLSALVIPLTHGANAPTASGASAGPLSPSVLE